MTFIQESSKAKEVDDQIHVIWYVFIPFFDVVQVITDNALRFCFEPDVSRPLLPLEVKFFNENRAWNGKFIQNV
jgi:hypothetical protein